MATYKVIQDVEAEDKLIGPLTLRQFIYAGVSIASLYLCWVLATHHAAFMMVVFLPIAAASGFFAFPWGRDQPTEIWALAKIRFLLKARKRIWDQSGTKQLVTVTAPKKVVVDYTNGLSSSEVESRLRALADTIDSRGWAIKNASLNVYGQSSMAFSSTVQNSDRLVQPLQRPQEVSNLDIKASDDILDERNNPRAQAMDNMITASEQAHRQRLLDTMNRPPEPIAPPPPAPAVPQTPTPSAPVQNNYWFMNQPAQASTIPSNMVTFNTQVVTPGTPEDEVPGAPTAVANEAELVHQLDAHKLEAPDTSYFGHLHTLQPLSSKPQTTPAPAPIPAPTPLTYAPMGVPPATPTGQPIAQPTPSITTQITPTPPAPAPVTPPAQAAILQELSGNDDLNVATIAREAERATASQDEVVIKLH